MYPGRHAVDQADRACFIMADTGETVTYAEFEARTNKAAHLLRANGLTHGDHYSIFMENNSRYLEMCGVGERAGLHDTCVNSHLTVDELVYIVNNSESKELITSRAKREVAMEAVKAVPERNAVPHRRRHRRRRAVRRLRLGGGRVPVDADRRRTPRRSDAVLVGNHRATEGDRAPAR